MIKILLSLIILILVLVFFWKMIFLKEPKKVKMSEDVQENERQIKENYTTPEFAQPNNKNNNMEKLEKIYDQINPYNFYTQNYNTPNFTTNVADLRKFYAYDLPPDSPEKTLPIPVEPYIKEQFTTQKQYGEGNQFIDREKREGTPWYYPKRTEPPSGLEYESDYWVYKNEMPMNGGKFGDIVGYENMGSSFSLFYDKNVPDLVAEQEKFLKKDDDLRNGMGTPQKQKYLYNMARP